jgi:BTB/POZ domain-containing protein 9
VSEYLKSILSQTNMCLVYDVANLYQLRALMEACRQYADRHATDILQSDAFLQLSPVISIVDCGLFMHISNLFI